MNDGLGWAGRAGELEGGRLLAAISTALVGIQRERYGRGAMHAKTFVMDDVVLVVMRESGLTPLEQTIVDAGHPERVERMREEFLGVVAPACAEAVEKLTGRRVLSFLPRASVIPDVTVQVFLLDSGVPGFGSAPRDPPPPPPADTPHP